MVKALIFDLDETLCNRQATMKSFLSEQYIRFESQLTVSREEFISENLLEQNNGYTEKTIAFTNFCEKRFQDKNLPQKLFNDYIENYGSNAVAIEGAATLLNSLVDKYTLAMITNGKTACQNKKIDSLGIRKFFKTIKISQQEGIAKPNKRIFENCLKDIEVSPENCVFIGDHPINDIDAAKSLGMKAIWIKNSKYNPPQEFDAIINSLEEFSETLEQLKKA